MEEEVNWGGQEKDARPVTTGNAKDPHISWTWHGPMSLCKGPTHVTPSCSPRRFSLDFRGVVGMCCDGPAASAGTVTQLSPTESELDGRTSPRRTCEEPGGPKRS